MVRKELFATSRVILLLLASGVCSGSVITFEDVPLAPQSYWNGSDGSGGFTRGGASFSNHFDLDWGFWDGFACSNVKDTLTVGWQGQYATIAGAGQGGSANYTVAYVGWPPPTITFAAPQQIAGVYVTNSTYAYYDMIKGSSFSKKFGGSSGNDPDWFKLTITGKDASGQVTGAVDYYLADFRFADNSKDHIVSSWVFVDLRSLGSVNTIEFSLNSSDVGGYGMNTPAYFCLDTLVCVPPSSSPAGPGTPYSSDPGIDGYVDPTNIAHASPQDGNAVLNPLFRGWASGVAEYSPSDDTWSGLWNDPGKALGPVTGDNLDIVSLGELSQTEISAGKAPGHITLVFGDPNDPQDAHAIHNGKGYDFAVFENGIVSQLTTTGGSVQGQLLAELAYVEVSSNGRDFVRFPSVSLTPARVGAYGTADPGNIHNLAGKHPNAGGICEGTPFDLDDLAALPDVVSGKIDLNAIHYVRLVDIPGSGDFFDDAVSLIDPATWPAWATYTHDHPIYDQWFTWGSGGFDLEAIGVLGEQQYEADINLDGVVDEKDLALMESAWGSHFGAANWNGRCDLAKPHDGIVDEHDLDVLARQLGCVESWRKAITTK